MIDIIIPTYNNLNGLITTLNSIPEREELNITIIDDCSTQDIDYNNIASQYKLFKLSKNSGPGMARQYGIDNTYEPYLMFIDTGDIFMDNIFDEVIEEVKSNPSIDIFSFVHKSNRAEKNENRTHNRMHGRIYKREFLKKYNICFCETGSYANEDIGFNRICRLLINEGLGEHKFIDKLIYEWIRDDNSLTLQNNKEFGYKKQNVGLALNAIYVYNKCKGLISADALEKECGYIIGSLYNNFLQTASERPEFVEESWAGAHLYYTTIYKPNNYGITPGLYQLMAQTLRTARKKNWNKHIPINIQRFLKDLDNYNSPPSWYLIKD